MLRPLLPLLLFLMTALPPLLPPASGAPAAPPAAPLDLLPLKKALAPLSGSGPLFSHSILRMTGAKDGVSVTLREDLQIVSRRPERFHASVTQSGSMGGPQTKLIVVSNGASVWTYEPALHVYSAMPLTAFKTDDKNIPTLGLIVGGFYLGDGRPLVDGFHSITATNNAAVLSALSSLDVTMSRQTKSVGGQDDYVYSLTLTQQNLAYQFYVATQTNRLARVDLSGIQNGTLFTYREDILSISQRQNTSGAAFVFIPPPGTGKLFTAVVHSSRRPHAPALP